MPVHIARPATVLGAHKITTAEIVDDIRARHPDHPRLAAILRVIANCGVQTRYFTQPLDSPTISGDATISRRAPRAFTDALAMAEAATLTTLSQHGLRPCDIDAIVTSHATGWAIPNLDVHLIHNLGFKPTTRRLPLTTLACAGGVHALIRACELAMLRPGSRILVLVAEVLSTVYNHQDTAIEHMIYKALFGDSAAATVITSGDPLGPGLTVNGPEDTLEFILPDSLHRYTGRIDDHGLHFDSTRAATRAAKDAMPTIVTWLDGQRIDVPVIHPGSKPIILDTATAVDLTEADARHSLDTLNEEGNLGGVSVLRVLERTHGDPPAEGAEALMVAYGPGFSVSALHGTWAG
ncbi:PhlD [Streptomyces sp. TS71-3]|uniref:PhlD n=1 Tax=Streptomyces sp. TS71-3 TaxID=2733862 RepID=UPI001B19C2D6|nr:PhlD [Streptomyces sp. TS71-3]GHJ39238.1 hypothetical protein Sm713_48470 [Streptomyces sp. TS71-3]